MLLDTKSLSQTVDAVHDAWFPRDEGFRKTNRVEEPWGKGRAASGSHVA